MEFDRRFPTGEWTGFYIEAHNPRRGWMHLYLQFADQQIRGEGTDYVGPWHVTGTYDSDTGICQWLKQYIGQHQVQYQGQAGDNGIQGEWEIGGWFTGPFHIWPRDRQDLQQLYLQDDLQLPAPSIQLQTPLDVPHQTT